MATGYDAQGNEAFFYNLGWAAPAGQMYSTVNDLMKVTTTNSKTYMCHVTYYTACFKLGRACMWQLHGLAFSKNL